MKNELKKVNRLGNGVAFLSGAMLNIAIAIIQNGITEDEWYLLIAAAVGGMVWLVLYVIYQCVR